MKAGSGMTVKRGRREICWNSFCRKWAQNLGGEDVIMVKEGKVATMNAKAAPGEEVVVGSLKKTRVKAGEAPSEPENLTPAEIAMFDVLDDLHEEIKEDIYNDIINHFIKTEEYEKCGDIKKIKDSVYNKINS